VKLKWLCVSWPAKNLAEGK